MKRNLLVALAAVVALGLTASMAQAGCDFEHPRKAKLFKCDFVQAFVSCGNPGGNAPNTTSASGVPGCTPPETFNQQAGTPINGWQWWEQRSIGKLTFREIQGGFGGNTRDLKVKMRLRRILDGTGSLAGGSGTLSTLARTTLEDTVISAPGMGTDMTIIDFPAPFPFSMSNGNASLTTTANILIAGLGIDPLPGCTSIETVSITVLDPNGNAFGACGVFFKDLPN
jgi:hypothetical protein